LVAGTVLRTLLASTQQLRRLRVCTAEAFTTSERLCRRVGVPGFVGVTPLVEPQP
jgi:hypothetical protein